MAPNSKNTIILVVHYYTVLISVQMELNMNLLMRTCSSILKRLSDMKFRGHYVMKA